MSTSAQISNGTQTTFPVISKPNISTRSSFLNSSSHLTFSTHFPKSGSSCLRTHSKSTRTTPIKATTVADTVYVNPDISFYDLLGISESGTLSEIKKAYKQLARKYHPDVSPPGRTEEYTKRFLQVQEAYETLSDPRSRAMYDRGISRPGVVCDTILSRRRRSQSEDQGFDGWEQRWESQLDELIRMSNYKDSESMSWGAKMRSRRCCAS